MYRRAIAITGCLTLTLGSAVVAQDESMPASIDAPCSEAFLEPMTFEATLDAEQTAALDALLGAFVTVPDDPEMANALGTPAPAPGSVIYVDSPDGRYSSAIGVADFETCEPLEPTSAFPIGSHTKMFVAAVIYQLQEEGLLSTSDLVSEYLPDEIGLFPRSVDATIDQLLTHTAGLSDWESSVEADSLGTRIYAGDPGALGQAMTTAELISMTAELQDDPDQPTFAPGEPGQWSYANVGFNMLGLIIEQVTGQPWTEAVRERVLEPLGMDDTVLVEGVAPAELGLPSGYLAPPFEIDANGWDYSQGGAAGNGVSTAQDMATFVEAYFSGQLFGDPATLEAVLEPAAPGHPGFLEDFQYLHGAFEKSGFLGHGGAVPGFSSDAGYDPGSDTTIVTWANVYSRDYQVPAGEGVLNVGHALGLTPSFGEVLMALFAAMSEPAE